MSEIELPDIEVELPKLPPMGYGNDGYSTQAMHEYAVEYAYKFAREAVAAERERCAKACEDLDLWDMDDPGASAAAAIRRG